MSAGSVTCYHAITWRVIVLPDATSDEVFGALTTAHIAAYKHVAEP
jgi:hypothetical protein